MRADHHAVAPSCDDGATWNVECGTWNVFDGGEVVVMCVRIITLWPPSCDDGATWKLKGGRWKVEGGKVVS